MKSIEIYTLLIEIFRRKISMGKGAIVLRLSKTNRATPQDARQVCETHMRRKRRV